MEQEKRVLTFAEAILEAAEQKLSEDPSVYMIGEGVPDPKAIFNTTKGLQEKFGKKRVFDMPVSENGLTGIIIGSAITGMKPILVHQRIDFSLYALDQVINNAAKWHSMYGGQSSCPIVIRMIVGRGWGQGNQHSQNLQSIYAHVPGLKVVEPSNAYEAKGLFISAINDPNPVIFIEHRWLHNTTSHVPEEIYEIPIGKANLVHEGKDLTLVTWSYATLECIKACDFLKSQNISVDLINIRSLSPLDRDTIIASIQKTKKLLVVDDSWRQGGFAAEIITSVVEIDDVTLDASPKRITYPDYPSPSTPGLAKFYYPTLLDIMNQIGCILKRDIDITEAKQYVESRIDDIPDKGFKGPF